MKFGSRRLILGIAGITAASLLIAGMANGQTAPAGQRGTAAPAAGQRGPATPSAPAAQRGTAAAAPAGQAQRMPMAEEVFKNVTALKGIPVDEFMRGLTQGSALDSGFEIWRALFAFAVSFYLCLALGFFYRLTHRGLS